jgi:hypothetical protein
MRFTLKEIEAALNTIATFGSVHAAHVAQVRPRMTELMAYDFDPDDLYTAESAGLIKHFLLEPSRWFRQIKPLLAELGGFEEFWEARDEVEAHLTRAYELIWAALDATRPVPPLKFISDSKYKTPFGTAARYDPDMVGSQPEININTDSAAIMRLLALHPFPSSVEIPLLLALDPCYQVLLYSKPAHVINGVSNLTVLLHECLHLLETDSLYEIYDAETWLAAGGRLDSTEQFISAIKFKRTGLGVVHTRPNNLSPENHDYWSITSHQWSLFDDPTKERVRFDHQGFGAGFINLMDTGYKFLLEGINNTLTLYRLSEITQIVDDPFLSMRPVYPDRLFDLMPSLLAFGYHEELVYPAEVLTRYLSLAQVNQLRAHPEDLAPFFTVAQAHLSASQVEALVSWLDDPASYWLDVPLFQKERIIKPLIDWVGFGVWMGDHEKDLKNPRLLNSAKFLRETTSEFLRAAASFEIDTSRALNPDLTQLYWLGWNAVANWLSEK